MLDSTIQIRVTSAKKNNIKKNAALLSRKLGIKVSVTDYFLYLDTLFIELSKEQS